MYVCLIVCQTFNRYVCLVWGGFSPQTIDIDIDKRTSSTNKLRKINMDTSTFAIIHITKNANRMRILLPEVTDLQHLKFEHTFRKYILKAGDHYYEINVAHREWVVEQLRYLYEGVIEYREHSAFGRCDTRCENANVYVEELEKLEEEYRETICVCRCLGEFHGGGGEWKYVIGTTLISETIKLVTRYYPSLDWQLMASPLPLWIEELQGPHPVYAMIRNNMLPAIPSEQETN